MRQVGPITRANDDTSNEKADLTIVAARHECSDAPIVKTDPPSPSFAGALILAGPLAPIVSTVISVELCYMPIGICNGSSTAWWIYPVIAGSAILTLSWLVLSALFFALRYTCADRADSSNYDKIMMLHVWVKRPSGWILAAHQTTRVDKLPD